MNPIELLKQEHVVILRMGQDIERRLRSFREQDQADPAYIDTAVDFIRTYADFCHHGKEEGILFRALEKKKLEPPLVRLMKELVQEHDWARATTKRLAEANRAYAEGDTDQLASGLRLLRQIQSFYPGHITKEESRFFNPCLEYFSEEELETMLVEFAAFDRKVIHEKYLRLVETLSDEQLDPA
ncbi:MAG TPA: hemerythrin domain-containing protein [Thermoleophilia bacterium]|nr:hemerythrin domain-containing protein [Thermoleophilia bacterium]